ncbi:RING-H2 finger protein ATL79-like [Wolffia australiana]
MRYAEMGEAAPPRNGHGGDWGPFKNAAGYGASMAVVMGLLLSAFTFGLLLTALVKLLFRRRPGGAPPLAAVFSGGPASSYEAGRTELAGSAAVCAICLSEFAHGETLRVLSLCKHGFHADCVDAWWAASAVAVKPVNKSSPPCCPLCRALVCPERDAPEA